MIVAHFGELLFCQLYFTQEVLYLMKKQLKKNLIRAVQASAVLATLMSTGFTFDTETLHYTIPKAQSVYGINFEKSTIDTLKIVNADDEFNSTASVQIQLANVYNTMTAKSFNQEESKEPETEQVQKTILQKAPTRTVVNGADYAPLDESSTNKSTSYLSFNGKTTAAVLNYHDTFDRTGTKGELIGQFIATAYDTSHNEYSTATSIVLSDRSLEDIKVIAVDPNIIPLMSKVYIEFPEPYAYLNGVYMAADTGGKIKQNVVDIFWGDFGRSTPQSLWDFGRRGGINIYTVK